MAFESAREEALVGEAGEDSDFRQQRAGSGQLAAGEVDAEPADVFADGAVAMLPEDSGQVGASVFR